MSPQDTNPVIVSRLFSNYYVLHRKLLTIIGFSLYIFSSRQDNKSIMMEIEPRVAILQDLRLQTFDTIRFASYRTASKLRYIQKSTNLHLVDIWNVIEAFRENGLNTLEPQSEVSVARLETLVSSLYHNLNKRLPTAQQVPVDSKAGLLLNWLLSAYTR